MLKAEQLALSGVKLNTVLDQGDDDEEPSPLLQEMQGKRGRAPRVERPVDADEEVFYERMRLTEELEELLTTLYRDFLELRLTATWKDTVVPALRRFTRGEEIDAEAYRASTPRRGVDTLQPAAAEVTGTIAKLPAAAKPKQSARKVREQEADQEAVGAQEASDAAGA